MRSTVAAAILLVLFRQQLVAAADRDDIVLYGEERPLSGTDRVAILQRDNDEIRYNSISSGEECIIRKFVTLRPVERCENFDRVECDREFVLARRLVRENCTVQAEYCETFHRTQRVPSATVLCQMEYEVQCPDGEEKSTELVCHPRRAAYCKRKSRMLTMTEKKQKCNGDSSYRTTKMCVTYTSGSGSCVDFTSDLDYCDDRDELKIISSEVEQTGGSLDCSSTPDTESNSFCHPANCNVTSNRTECVSDSTPEIFELKEVICEKCLDERVKVRPVVEEREVCRNKTQRFCLTVDEESVKWRKWCRGILVNRDSKFGKLKQKPKSEGEVYHIEVSPGRWVITEDKDEAEILLRQQEQMENASGGDDGHAESPTEDSVSQRLRRCTKNRKHCVFRRNAKIKRY